MSTPEPPQIKSSIETFDFYNAEIVIALVCAVGTRDLGQTVARGAYERRRLKTLRRKNDCTSSILYIAGLRRWCITA